MGQALNQVRRRDGKGLASARQNFVMKEEEAKLQFWLRASAQGGCRMLEALRWQSVLLRR